jgi:hypothetical protein
MLTARWDHRMTQWRIPDHVYPFEIALRSGADVVVSSERLADALRHASQPADADRFDGGGAIVAGANAGRVWLLGADDALSLIEDHHIAELDQRQFDELVDGLGTSRTLAWRADDPQAAVVAYAALTAEIRAAIG